MPAEPIAPCAATTALDRLICGQDGGSYDHPDARSTPFEILRARED
jgi:hypothetical protein